LIMTTCPITIFLLSLVLRTGKLNIWKALGLVLGFTGAILLLLGRTGQPISSKTSLGDGLVLFNAVAYSLFLVIQKPLLARYHVLTLISYSFLLGGILVVPWGLPEVLSLSWSQLPLDFWLTAGFIILCTTILAYLINSWALAKVEPEVVGVYIYLQPILATAIAVSIGQDVLTLDKFLCGGMILAGVYLVGRK